jgi:hypothetical protein
MTNVSGPSKMTDMTDNQASANPVLIEVPRPKNLMTQSEKDEFIAEIILALESK